MTNPTMQNVVHLNRYFHFTELMRDPQIELDIRRYRSEFDGSMQSLSLLRPASHESEKQFFFFHGMDGDCGDAVILRDLVKQQNATVIATGGRGPVWLGDGFVADAVQTIAEFANSSSGFYLIGVSMGGTQALSLAGLLPENLRARIAGVVALIPGSDLQAMAERSAHERVRNTVQRSATNLHKRSPINLVSEYRPGLPFAIFYNQDDTLLLSDTLAVFIETLRGRGHPVASFVVPGDHNFTYSNFDYVEVMQSLGCDSNNFGAPLRSNEGGEK